MRDNTSREKSREKTDCGKLVALKKKSTTTTTTDTTQRLVPEVPETRKKQHPLSLKSKRIKEEPSQVADNSHLKDKLEKLCKPVNLAAAQKDLQGRPEKQNLW